MSYIAVSGVIPEAKNQTLSLGDTPKGQQAEHLFSGAKATFLPASDLVNSWGQHQTLVVAAVTMKT